MSPPLLPAGPGDRIRHYGLFANTGRAANVARLRELLGSAPAQVIASPSQDEPAQMVLPPCPCCGGRMIVIEFFERGMQPRYRSPSPPSSGSTRHELRCAGKKLNAVFDSSQQRRADGSLFVEFVIWPLSPITLHSVPGCPAHCSQRQTRRRKISSHVATRRGHPPALISIVHRCCPRFPSSGAFRRRPGSRRPAHIHPAAI